MTLCVIEALAPMLIPMAIGVAGSIGKMFQRGASNRRLANLASRMPGYQIDEAIKRRLGLSQALLNARMPGAAAAERNIYQTQANQIAAAERAATDPNQLLLAGAGATGQAQQMFGQLSQQEAADYQRRYGNLMSAEEAMAAEKQREFENRMRNYQMQAEIEAAQQENRQNTWGDISNLGFAGAYAAQQGAFNNMFGKSGGARISPPIATAPGRMYSTQGMGQGFGFSPSTTAGVPSNLLSMGYGQQPYSWAPSNMLNMGYGQQQPYSWAGRNWLTQ